MRGGVKDGCRGTILVVDDEAIVRALTQRVLERQGFDVVLAKDGIEAVELFARHCDAIDAVVLDVEMPRMNGVAALAVMRIMRQEVPVILSSGLPPEDIRERLAGASATATLHKPYSPDDLVNALRESRLPVPHAATHPGRASAGERDGERLDHAARV